MPGTEYGIAFRDASGRVRFNTGDMSGVVIECVNMQEVTISPGDPVQLVRQHGSATPNLPAPSQVDDPPKLLVACGMLTPIGFDDNQALGVAIDFMAKSPGLDAEGNQIPGARGRVAGPGCIATCHIHLEWDVGGGYVVAGDGIDGAGIRATPDLGKTVGLATSLLVDPADLVGGGYCGVLVQPR